MSSDATDATQALCEVLTLCRQCSALVNQSRSGQVPTGAGNESARIRCSDSLHRPPAQPPSPEEQAVRVRNALGTLLWLLGNRGSRLSECIQRELGPPDWGQLGNAQQALAGSGDYSLPDQPRSTDAGKYVRSSGFDQMASLVEEVVDPLARRIDDLLGSGPVL